MTATTSTATTPDYDEIVRVVQLYVDGFQGDVDKFREAFHEDAWIFSPTPTGFSTKISLLTISRSGPPTRFSFWAASFL